MPQMATNSDMFVKYGPKVYFGEEYKYKHRGSNCTINKLKLENFKDYLIPFIFGFVLNI